MDLLNNILGAGGQGRQGYEDFIQRYDKGRPWDGIADDEAARRYREVAVQAPPDVFEDSAADAFERLDPQERREFARWLRERSGAQGGGGATYFDTDRDGIPDKYEDPRELARETSRLQREQPGILDQLLGKGGTGGTFDNPIAKAAFAGIAAMVAQRVMGGMAGRR